MNNLPEKKSEEFKNAGISKNCVTGFVCENAHTYEFHQESDCSYTTIGVPLFTKGALAKLNKYKFQFRWNYEEGKCTDRSGIDILLTPGTCIAYSGALISHRQFPHGRLKEGNFFFNLSSYHNNRLCQGLLGIANK